MKLASRWILTLALVFLPAAAPAIDGVIEINSTTAQQGGVTPGDAVGLPVTLSRRGSYRLTGDLLSNNPALAVIEITADRVSLDLNGFTVGICVDGGLCGVGGNADVIAGLAADTRIRNGSVAGGRRNCVRAGTRADLRNLHVAGCTFGIDVAANSLVVGVSVSDASLVGVNLGEGSLLRDSVVTGSGAAGVQVANSGLLVDTVIRDNQSAISGPFNQSTKGGYRGCVITRNPSGEVQQIGSHMRNLGGNICGTDTICP